MRSEPTYKQKAYKIGAKNNRKNEVATKLLLLIHRHEAEANWY